MPEKEEKPRSKVYSLERELVVSIPPDVVKELDIKDGTYVEWSINPRNRQAYLKPSRPLSPLLLPYHTNTVFKAILELGPGCITGDVYNRYVGLIKNSGKEPLTRRRVSGIVNELSSIYELIETRREHRGRYGTTKRVIRIKGHEK